MGKSLVCMHIDLGFLFWSDFEPLLLLVSLSFSLAVTSSRELAIWGISGTDSWDFFLVGMDVQLSGRAGGGRAWLGLDAALGWTQRTDGKIPHLSDV